MITGMRGLCNGLGPAVFGFIFYLFHVDLNEAPPMTAPPLSNGSVVPNELRFIPGPPFVFGALLVMLALLVAAFIPDNTGPTATSMTASAASGSSSRSAGSSRATHQAVRVGGLELFHHDVIHKRSSDCGTLPLMHDTDPL